MGLNTDVVIIGGLKEYTQSIYNSTIHVMLEPKSLQQLAVQTIDKNKALIPWQGLPNNLIAKFGWVVSIYAVLL